MFNVVCVQDVQYGDVDYMESKLLFTYDKQKYSGLPEFVDLLHERGQKYIIILVSIISGLIHRTDSLFNIKLNIFFTREDRTEV